MTARIVSTQNSKARSKRARELPAVTPLVLALLAVLPLRSLAQTAIVRPIAPPPSAVPIPSASWRVYGTGATAPINTPNANGGVDQRIDQTSNRAIYQWNSFDIGAASKVQFVMPDASSSALNRVQNSVAPSQIFGRLESNGQIFLINTNGVLFGSSARVDVGALVASTLNVRNSDYISGLTESILGTTPSFSYDGDPARFTDAQNFVRVDTGAEIVTPSGGRVFLFAKNVQNAGSITTPGGQTVLAAGSEVYLNNPTNESLYASEVNPNIPALRGLLVEVGKGNGTVTNSGDIVTARGNTTLVGMAVNQTGRISATTSVSENGSVFLLARGNAAVSDDGQIRKRATEGGTLTLGAGSEVSIKPDTQLGTDGKPLMADGNSSFTSSRVELSGQTIELQSGSKIVAPGGIVNARAEDVPNYLVPAPVNPASTTAKLIVGDQASIDVAGTTDTSVSVARNFVTTELLGGSDLKDAPLQKDGPVYRSRVTFDIREAAPILGDTSSYVKGVKKTADELLSSGGRITLSSTGAVVTHERSLLDVSGGKVTYTDAVVTPTVLIAADGSRVAFNKASKDVVYTAIEGKGTGLYDRWGPIIQYGSATTGHTEKGYVDGQAGGQLQVIGRTVVLDGAVNAGTTSGTRQQTGKDALASGGSIQIGANAGDAIVDALAIRASQSSLGNTFWADPLNSVLPDTGRIAASTLNNSGARKVSVSTNGTLEVENGADIVLPDRSSVTLTSRSDLTIDADVRTAGGSITAQAIGNSGTLSLSGSSHVDASGTWVNFYRGGAAQTPALAGGNVTLSSTHGMNLANGSVVDASGGGSVSASGAVSGTNAGSITIAANTGYIGQGTPEPMYVGSTLHGESLANGASLTVRSAKVDIVAASAAAPLRPGNTQDSLVLGTDFFTQGGFSSYDIGGSLGLTVHSGATLAPRTTNWIPTASTANLPSGSKPRDTMAVGMLPDGQRKAANLSLSSSGVNVGTPTGSLTIESGARIEADATASVSLTAGSALVVDGAVHAAGGKVAMSVGSNFSGLPLEGVKGTFRVGSTADIDVSGTTVLTPNTTGLRRGTVLDGGSVSFEVQSNNARLTPIEILAGAKVHANGTTGTLDVDTRSDRGISTSASTIASDGGSIVIKAKEGGALLQGDLQALAGGRPAAAGSFTLDLQGRRNTEAPLSSDVGSFVIHVQSAADRGSAATPGAVTIGVASLQRNFADVSLSSMDRIEFGGDVRIAMPRSLELDAPVIGVDPGRTVTLSGATQLRIGNSRVSTTANPVPAATGGTGTLSAQSGLIELFGEQSLQGVGNLQLRAGTEMRVDGVVRADGTQFGALKAQGDVAITAPQLAPTSNTQYVLDAGSGRVSIGGGDTNATPTLSANGDLTIRARTIEQNGVVRAPFGRITFEATDGVTLGAGSLTSVSGAGLTVPFGNTVAGTTWQYNGQTVNGLLEKGITLNAPDGKVAVNADAVVDLSGGGTVQALEFVAGPGGSKDIFAGAANGAYAIVPGIAGYAPQDLAILSQPDASGAFASGALARQITVGQGGPLPAGTYTLLPARYAVLPGAFLVQPTTSGPSVALGFSETRANGGVLVGATLSTRGTAYADPLPIGVVITPSAQARKSSEIRVADADAFFAAKAAAAGQTAPRLPRDAGTLALVGRDLELAGRTKFDVTAPTDGSAAPRGGELDIAASRIVVDATGAPSNGGQSDGSVHLSTDQLNASGAQSILLGGVRRAGQDGQPRQVDVSASQVTVEAGTQPLATSDLILAATGTVEVKAGVKLQSGTSSAPADALAFTGDGALLRVSGTADAKATRTGSTGSTGDLVIGAGVSVQGGSVTAEGTRSVAISDTTQIGADALTLSAPRIAVGASPTDPVSPTTLVLSPSLTTTIGQIGDVTLRGRDGLSFYGDATLGGDGQKSLTLDTGSLQLASDGGNVQISAGALTLTNTTGRTGTSSAGTGHLQLTASGGTSGGSSGSGHLTLGPGAMAISGVQDVKLTAAGSLVAKGATSLTTVADVTAIATTLTTADGAQAVLRTGAFTFAPQAAPGTAYTAGLGGHLEVDATRIEQGGQIVLPSGEVVLNASGSAGDRRAMLIRAGSLIDVAGRDVTIGGTTVHTAGGSVSANVAQGNLLMDRNATIDVSASRLGGDAGTLVLSAANGSLGLGGNLIGRSQSDGKGAELHLDSATPLNLTTLSTTIASQANAGVANFGGVIDVRNRVGDQTLAAGTTLRAQNITLESDAGKLTVAGTLDANGTQGGKIQLAAGSDLVVAGGASITARATVVGQSGGSVEAASTTGTISLNAGALVDTSSSDGKNDGKVQLRASRTAIDAANPGGTGVAVAPIAANIVGASTIEVEAVKVYNTSVVDKDVITEINADTLAFVATDGSRAASIKRDLAGSNTALAGRLHLRAGVEVRSDGDLEVVGDPARNGWNLTSFNSNGTMAPRPGGEPINLTLRAAGDLRISSSLSDGFKAGGGTTAAAAATIRPAAVIQPGESASMRLVGGADLTAAAPMRVSKNSNAGDVIIGNGSSDVMVRTSTGNIDIAAARDVTLTDPLAVVYTTGTPVTTLPVGYVAPTLATASIRDGATRQVLFLDNGGSINVNAGRDVVGGTQSSAQYGVDWWWRTSRPDSMYWYNRYDKFQQGIATFGGGDVSVNAGRDAINVNASAAGSGFIPNATLAANTGATVRQYGGGSVALSAGRDVVGGFVFASGANAGLRAGRSIVANDSGDVAQILWGDTKIDVSARNDIQLGRIAQAGLVAPVIEFQSTPPDLYASGLTPKAQLSVSNASGNVSYTASRPSTAPASGDATSTVGGETVLPSRTSMSAPAGSLSVAELTQLPAADSSLTLVARDAVDLKTLRVAGTTPASATPTQLTHNDVDNLTGSVFDGGLTPFDNGTNRDGVRIASRDGDVTVGGEIQVAKPLQLSAGRDIVMNAPITIQHQNDNEISTIVSGRDLLLPSTFIASGFSLRVLGPGDLVVAAGRNINLSLSGGIGASGNRDNRLLPSGSARLTVLAGVSLDGSDAGNARSRLFAVLGSGMANFTADFEAQLLAAKNGQVLPGLDSAEARRFKSLSVADQLAEVKTLAGDAAYSDAVFGYMRQREVTAPANADAALTAFNKLSAAEQAPLVGRVLSGLWTARVAPADQVAQTAAMAASLGDASYAAALTKFVKQRTDRDVTSTFDAIRLFNSLSKQEQALFSIQVLVNELRASGRAASKLTGTERDAAYALGYAALDSLFPASNATGSINMGSSQVKTLQGSGITLLAPRGGVNVGEIVGGAKSASELGIVTADGGAISVVANNDIAVNQSRVFTVGRGDLLMWSSLGNIDAGRGAKTVSGAPAPVFSINSEGKVVVDTSGSFSGSGIAVLDADSTLDLYAPRGEINAGDAGIKSAGNAFFGAIRFVGADNLSVGGVAVGAPPPAVTGGATAGLASLGQSATSAGLRAMPDDNDEERERKRRKRLNLILDFLGFGDGSTKQ